MKYYVLQFFFLSVNVVGFFSLEASALFSIYIFIYTLSNTHYKKFILVSMTLSSFS